MAPNKSIPNDIYQFSTFTALGQGFTSGQPRICDLSSHGTHGIGAIEGTKELVTLHEGVASVTDAEGNSRMVKSEERLCFAMVTVFEPVYRITCGLGGRGCEELKEILGDAEKLKGIGGNNSLLAFEIEGDFRTMRLEVSNDGNTRELQSVTGTIFGYRVPTWMEGICGPGLHCHFVGEEITAPMKHMVGGRVEAFEMGGDTLVRVGKCGRFHLGFPQSEEWERMELSSK